MKIHLSVADHRKTSAVWADLAKRGMLVELWRKAGEKYAGRTADRVSLRPTDRMDIAGTTIQAEADRAVTALCSELGYELRTYPNRWDVKIRKFSKKQGFKTEELQHNQEQKLRRTFPSDSDSDSDTNTDSEKKERAPAPRTIRASGKTACPEILVGDQAARIRSWAQAQGISDAQLQYAWSTLRDWAAAGNKRMADWEATFRNALRKGWVLDGFGRPAGNGPESPAQAKQRRINEAAAEAFRQMTSGAESELEFSLLPPEVPN